MTKEQMEGIAMQLELDLCNYNRKFHCEEAPISIYLKSGSIISTHVSYETIENDTEYVDHHLYGVVGAYDNSQSCDDKDSVTQVYCHAGFAYIDFNEIVAIKVGE